MKDKVLAGKTTVRREEKVKRDLERKGNYGEHVGRKEMEIAKDNQL